jgi:radical SAM superfamily enzyme YgiQ (UPF0313 family)
LIHTLACDGDVLRVPGIVFEHAGRIYETPMPPLVRSLDSLPSPYQSGIFDFSHHATATMLSSRGCTFNCAFCYTPSAFGRTIRAHSPERVMRDMAICVKNGLRRYFFADPSFTFNKRRVTRIMDAVIKRRWNIEMWVETRADLVDNALLRRMAAAGVTRIAFGLESSDPSVNRMCNKNMDLLGFANAVRQSQQLGITVEAFTLYGLPGQTYESAAATVEFLKSLGIEISGNSAGQKLNLFFGTDVQRQPAQYGLRVSRRRRPKYISAGIDFVSGAMSSAQVKDIARLYARQHPKKEHGECISLL